MDADSAGLEDGAIPDVRVATEDDDRRRLVNGANGGNHGRPVVLLKGHVAGEEEERGLVVQRVDEPLLLDHLLHWLHDRAIYTVLSAGACRTAIQTRTIVAGKVKEDAVGSHRAAQQRLELGEARADGNRRRGAGHRNVDVRREVTALELRRKVFVHVQRVVEDVQFVVADCHDVVRDLFQELVRLRCQTSRG